MNELFLKSFLPFHLTMFYACTHSKKMLLNLCNYAPIRFPHKYLPSSQPTYFTHLTLNIKVYAYDLVCYSLHCKTEMDWWKSLISQERLSKRSKCKTWLTVWLRPTQIIIWLAEPMGNMKHQLWTSMHFQFTLSTQVIKPKLSCYIPT